MYFEHEPYIIVLYLLSCAVVETMVINIVLMAFVGTSTVIKKRTTKLLKKNSIMGIYSHVNLIM